MRGQSFWIGSLLTLGMALASGAAFVETAHPVQARAAGTESGRVVCPTGPSGIPSSCAEVHATALASGAMSRRQFELAQAGLTALSAHTAVQ
jgi:hypothetical protein